MKINLYRIILNFLDGTAKSIITYCTLDDMCKLFKHIRKNKVVTIKNIDINGETIEFLYFDTSLVKNISCVQL